MAISTLSSEGSWAYSLDLTLQQSTDKKISILKIRLLLIRVIQFKRLVAEYMMRIQMSSQAMSLYTLFPGCSKSPKKAKKRNS